MCSESNESQFYIDEEIHGLLFHRNREEEEMSPDRKEI